MQANTQLIEMVSSFAKDNKISKAKLQEFTEQVINTLPKGKASSGKTGRPILEKTSTLYNAILEQIKDNPKDSVSICKAVTHLGASTIEYNNAISALVRQGKIFHAGKAKTGSRGRQPFILSTKKI